MRSYNGRGVLYNTLKVGVGLSCLYEAVAISADLAGSTVPPTISHEVGVWPWLGPVVIGGLAAHFYWPQLSAAARRVLRWRTGL